MIAARIVDLELSQPLQPVGLDAAQHGLALLARWHGRPIGFQLLPCAPATTVSAEQLNALAHRHFSEAVLTLHAEAALQRAWRPPMPRPPPALTIAVCTKDRPQRLARLLRSIEAVRAGSEFRELEVLVVDNASVDDATRRAAEGFAGVRCVREARTGLDFARNTALREARGELIAYLDDDVVVDRGWLDGLWSVWRDHPDAGGYSGLVLPLRLDTPAQVAFEAAGGFRRGFARVQHGAEHLANALHPVGVGVVGTGANMAFDRALVLALGGFDEALDTGAPLPGGGDLDMFYRVLRSGRGMVYEPRYAVFHEHRETLPQLRRQYWSWGLGFMAFLVKSRRSDTALRPRHAAMLRWWFGHHLRGVMGAIKRRDVRRLGFELAELVGGIQGLCGEYDRSAARSRRIRESLAS
jgi:glycosyltransferase involved in cell wall biosynthesis